MLNLINESRSASRRDFLRLGGLAFGGLGLSDILRLRAQAAGREGTQQKAVIFVYLFGGPSHVDSYDMKPDAPVPSEYLNNHTQLAAMGTPQADGYLVVGCYPAAEPTARSPLRPARLRNRSVPKAGGRAKWRPCGRPCRRGQETRAERGAV